MKRTKLLEYFNNHISNHPTLEKASSRDVVAMLFASKDIKIDRAKYRIRLPSLGWANLDKNEIMDFKFDWVAVFNEPDSSFSMVLGSGDPYQCDDLPMKNGIVTAVPFGLETL